MLHIHYVVNTQKNISNSGIVPNSNKDESDKPKMSKAKPESDIFTYILPSKAGSGSYAEELRRFRLFVSTQGVICQDIRHFGGQRIENEDPEMDHDGAWYLCLDLEVSLKPKSCIVYSAGYVVKHITIICPVLTVNFTLITWRNGSVEGEIKCGARTLI